MLALAEVVGEAAIEVAFAGGEHGVGFHAGGLDGGEFAFGVGPGVFAGAGDVEEAGSDGVEDPVGIEGEFRFLAAVLLEVGVEPVGETFVEVFGAFALEAAGDGGAAFAAVVGDDHGEAIIEGAGPEGGFADAGVAVDGDAAGIDVGVLGEVIHGAAEAPSPGGDGAPFAGSGFAVKGMNAIGVAVVEVGVEVAVIDDRGAVAAGDDVVDFPTGGAAAAGLGSALPAGGLKDRRVGVSALVAAETHAEKDGDAAGGFGEVEQKLEGIAFAGGGFVPDADLLANGFTAEGIGVAFAQFKTLVEGAAGVFAVHFAFEGGEDLAAVGRDGGKVRGEQKQ